MKMLIVLVKDSDADALTQAFTTGDYRVTRIASTSGLLKKGVVTMLAGVEPAQVEPAIELIRKTLPKKPGGEKRATLFVVPVERFEQV